MKPRKSVVLACSGCAVFVSVALLMPVAFAKGPAAAVQVVQPPASATAEKVMPAADSPAVLIRDTSNAVRVLLLTENGKNTDAVRVQVQNLLYPRFDFVRMTALAVGKNWKLATDKQKQGLQEEFRTLLTRTYFSAMLRYRNVKLNVKMNDVQMTDDGKQATVKSEALVTDGQQPVPINYVLYRTTEGWRVYDVSVSGASLVIVYRNQFNTEVSKGGIDGLIESLRTKNRSGDYEKES